MEEISRQHTIAIDNRKTISISGVQKVSVATPENFECIVQGKKLQIVGANLEVAKLDVGMGRVELNGRIDMLRYVEPKGKLLKRIFK